MVAQLFEPIAPPEMMGAFNQIRAVPSVGFSAPTDLFQTPRIPTPDFGFAAPDAPAFFGTGFAPTITPQFQIPDNVTPMFGRRGMQDAFNQMQSQWGQAGSTSYSLLDAHNNEFNRAGSSYNAPANLLKAMVNRESSGDWSRDGNRVAYLEERDDYILPFVGITKAAADAWGLDFWGMVGDKQAQIDGMAKIVSGLSGKYGGFDNAIKVYFGGEAALNGDWYDENGLGSNYYYDQAKKMWSDFDAQSGVPQIGGDYFNGNAFVDQAKQYVGVDYVWGGIPGKGDNPWDTGWDCSGFTYFMDQNYGSGTLPMGSHYQYQHAQNTGQLFTDYSQLQPGDLVFIDTGWQGGAGAELNNAGHVGIYIGNGQMIHAANPSSGTIISPLSGYSNVMGFMHQAGSGGGGWNGGGFSGNTGPVNNWYDWVRGSFY